MRFASMRLRSLLWVALLMACGPDKGGPHDCSVGPNFEVGPDFEVLVMAEYGPLPFDTVLRLHYGGRPFDDPEVLELADPGTPRALFCYVSDRNGVYPPDAPPLGGPTNGQAGAGGEGGASYQPGEPVDALLCRLWTAGSANLDVVTEMYGTVSLELETKKDVCVVKTTLELTLDDGGTK
jgi:hypothetical protein